MAFKHIFKEWYIRFTELRWIVGIAEYNPDTILDSRKKLKVHWVKPYPKDGWFADPFILSETDDHIHILVEQYSYAKRKARISKLVVNRHNWHLEQIVPVIETSTHLSFPVYYRENGKVYIYPENTQSGKLMLYEYDETTGSTIPVKVLSEHPLADAVIWKSKERPFVLATTAPKDNGKVLDIYPFTDDPSSGPEKHYSFNTYMARNAGLPFSVNGRQIRPAQDCTRSYGSCVVLQEIVEEGGEIQFKEIRRLYSPLFRHQEGFHTFNVFEDRLAAVDAEGFRHGLFAQLVYHIREWFK